MNFTLQSHIALQNHRVSLHITAIKDFSKTEMVFMKDQIAVIKTDLKEKGWSAYRI